MSGLDYIYFIVRRTGASTGRGSAVRVNPQVGANAPTMKEENEDTHKCQLERKEMGRIAIQGWITY